MPEQILLVVGLLMSIIGPALTFRGRRSRGYIMDIDDALPWMGGLALVGAGLLLLAAWNLPRAWTGGPALGVILLVFTGLGLYNTFNRLYWPLLYPEKQIFGLVAVGLALLLLLILTVHCWRKPRAVP